MQEPVLFNKTIKENILFGKNDATEQEVYIAADKANCIEFIKNRKLESQDESDIDNQISEFIKNSTELTSEVLLRVQSLEDEKLKKLGYQIVRNADSSLLSLITENNDRFMNTLTTEGLRPEAKWDSVAYYFEWTFEIDRIRDDKMLGVDLDSLTQDIRLKCNFDK